MTAKYEITVKFTIGCDVDGINDSIRDPHEIATSICNLICDEVALCGGGAMYEVIETAVNVK